MAQVRPSQLIAVNYEKFDNWEKILELWGKIVICKTTETKKIDRNNLIVDHSRDLRENKGKSYWQKITELLFGVAVESYPQLNETFEISNVLFTLDYKSKLETIIKKKVCTC